MKQSIAILILLLTIIPGIGQAGDPEGVPLSLKQATISATPVKKNKTTGTWDSYISIKNKTKLKLHKNIFGPVTLIITSINKSDVILVNSSGKTSTGFSYVTIPVPTEGLAAGKSIKRIQLKFSNPSNKPFKIKYKLIGSLYKQVCYKADKKPVTIQSIFPNKGSSGTIVTINGTGFDQCSKVYFGDKIIDNSEYISDSQIQWIVPFEIDQNQRLASPVIGKYPIKVNNSEIAEFEVTELPPNSKPIGSIITDKIGSSFDTLSSQLPNYQAILPELLAKTKDSPESQQVLQALNAFAEQIQSTSASALINRFNALDSQTLDILERALAASSPHAEITQNTVKSKGISAQPSCINPVGNDWLKCRKINAIATQAAKYETKLFSGCASVAATAAASAAAGLPAVSAVLLGVAKDCAAIAVATAVGSSITDAIVAHNYGIVRKIDLQVINLSDKDGHSSDGTLHLHLNNADNNSDIPSPNAKIAVGAILGISKQVNLTQSLDSLAEFIKELSGYDLIPIGEKLKEFAFEWVENKINTPSDTTAVNVDVLKHNLKYELFDKSLLPPLFPSLFSGPPCDIHDAESFYLMKTPAQGSSNWLFSVPDKGASWASDTTSVGDCEIKINNEYRMASEDDVSGKISFYVKRFPKMHITLNNLGYISYSRQSVSNKTECKTTDSPCVEYFDAPQGTQLVLTAYKPDGSIDDNVTWSGSGLSSTNCPSPSGSCVINLDTKNLEYPEVTASSRNDGIYSLDLSYGKYVHGWQAISCYSSFPDGCNVDFSLQEETNNDNIEGELQITLPCGTPPSLNSFEICKINGELKPVSIQRNFTAPYVGYGSGTSECLVKFNFDGSKFQYNSIETRKGSANWGNGTDSTTHILTFETTFDINNPSIYRKELRVNESATGPDGERGVDSIDYINGYIDTSKPVNLRYVRPIDSEYCNNPSASSQ